VGNKLDQLGLFFMRIAMAQINNTIGDFKSNSDAILKNCLKACEFGADLVVFPECAIFGYSPADLLERDSIIKAQTKFINQLVKKLPKDLYVLFGAITDNKKAGKKYNNSALLVKKNKIVKVFSKELLPNYDVFDEERHFESGTLAGNTVKIKGKTFLVAVCEDIWGWKELNPFQHDHNPLKSFNKKIDAMLVLNASPYSLQKSNARVEVAKKCVKQVKAPLMYVNMVGGQDELIFDGGSFAIDKSGKLLTQALYFQEDLKIINLDKLKPITSKAPKVQPYEELRQALVLGLRDFVNKIGMKKVHFGLSGGIDSALIACLAVEAVGPNNVTALALPGPFSSKLSFDLAKKLAQNLSIDFKKVDFNKTYKAMISDFEKTFGKLKFGLVHENFQARIRGDILMGFSNLNSSLLLNTSNKSELTVGYSTLYGDLCGGISPIGDLTKQQVFALCEHYNMNHELIPKKIISRPPTAELKPNQKDSDSLPPYNLLDKSIEKLVVNKKPATTAVDKRVLQMMMRSEFKRWQAPPILRVSTHAFGQGRRMPIAHKAIY